MLRPTPGVDAVVPSSRRQVTRRRIGTILITAGLAFAVFCVGLAYATAVHGGLQHGCLVEGPFSPRAERSERADTVTGEFSLWPLGRECTWLRADGAATVVAQPEWGMTVNVLAALGVVIVGAGLRSARP